jgi:hypothetical protein
MCAPCKGEKLVQFRHGAQINFNIRKREELKYYNIILEYGTEISSDGPYDSEQERDDQAKIHWQELKKDISNNIFKASVDENGELNVGVFIQGMELDE